MTVRQRSKRDHGRSFRLLMGFVIAVLLVVVPQVAQATFTSSKSANLSVGTLKLVAPATLTGQYRCPSMFQQNTGLVTVNFADVAGARGYLVTLTSSRGDSKSVTSTSSAASIGLPYYWSSVTWTVTAQATAASWTGSGIAKSFTCA